MSAPAPIAALVCEKSLTLPLLVRSGSKAYGLEHPLSDDDYLGVFLAPLRAFVSLHGIREETLTGLKPDFTLHEIGKFCRLALKGNPAILETLWSPDVVAQDEWGRELIALRERFLHRDSLRVYVAYAESQMKRMVAGKGLHAKGGTYNGKYGAHLLRLLHAGLHLAHTGEVTVRIDDALLDTLRRIRTGGSSMGEVLDMARPVLEELKGLSDRNGLPAEPDRDAVNDLVIRARLSRN